MKIQTEYSFFKTVKDLQTVENQIKEAAKRFKYDYVKIGCIGCYDVKVNASYNHWTREFTFSGGVFSHGFIDRKGHFKSIQEVINYAKSVVNDRLK